MIATAKRALVTVGVVVSANLLGYFGCKEVVAPSAYEAAREYCEAEARAEFYVGQSSTDAAMAVYRECMRAHGQGPQ